MPIVILVLFDNEDNSYIVQAPLALCQSSNLLGGIIDVVGWGHCGLILAYAQVGRSESDDFVDDGDGDDDDKELFKNIIIIFGISLTPPPPYHCVTFAYPPPSTLWGGVKKTVFVYF